MNWLLAITGVIALFALLHIVEKTDAKAERTAAMRADMHALDERIERAAAALCRAELGPGAQVLWTREGDVVCRPAVITAGGVQ